MSNGFRTGNGKITNGNRLIGRSLITEHNQFLQEQLMDAQQSLFFARSVKEAKFLQNRIDYLKSTLEKINDRKTKR